MPNRSKLKHDRPSATVLAEDKHFPRTEGQPEADPTQFRAIPPRTGKLITCFPVDRRFLSKRPVPAGVDTLDQARALLSNDPGRCAELGALPAGYSHSEPADFDEFFQPELSLGEAVEDQAWGLLDEPTGDRADQLEAISATITELHRGFDHSRPLSARLRFRLMAACREELRLLLAELEEAPPQNPTPETIEALTRAAESLLRGQEPPTEDEATFREWISGEGPAVVPDVEPGALESVIRSTLAGMRLAASPSALALYRSQLVGLLTRWQQVATAGGVA